MKTGGSTLLHQVLANVPLDSIWGAPGSAATGPDVSLERYTSVELLQRLDDDARAAISVVIGHLPFVVVDVAGFDHAMTATVLRDPVARIISYLTLCQASFPEHRDLPIEQIYEDEFYGPRLIRNHQTKMLGMTAEEATTPPARVFGPPHPLVVEALEANGYFSTTRYLLEQLDLPVVWEVPVDRSTLERACHNLDRVDVLGIHERFDAFLARLARCTGWTINDDIWANRGPTTTVSTSFRRRIEADNELDAELYEHARQLDARG